MLVSVSVDKDVVAPNCVNNVRHICCCILVTSEMVLTSFNNAKMADALNIGVLIFLHNIKA